MDTQASRVNEGKKQATSMPRAILWTSLLSEPLITLYSFLSFILYKDLGASAFAVSLLVMLKPVITVFSFYWSAGLKGSGKLKSNVLWAGFWMRAPFLLCPWIDSAWFVIGAAVNYMFFYRAGMPGWMEWIRRSTGSNRGRIISWSSGLGYAEGVVLSLGMGSILDRDPTLWKGLFFVAALAGLVSLVVQKEVKVEGEKIEVTEELDWKERIIRPWRDSYQLMRDRPDFSRFHWAFMIAGFGLMLIQPALPVFAVDWLHISYLEMAGAVSIAKGLGYVVSAPTWGRWIDRWPLMRVSCFVFILFGLFPLILSLSLWNVTWLYVAYFVYGIAHGGSHLIWHLSGPIFAGKEESSRYSAVCLVLAGMRGAVAPPLGGALVGMLGPVQVLVMGASLCIYSGFRFLSKKVCLESSGKI